MANKALSAFFLLLSLAYLYFAREMSVGSLGSPKSGFLPMVTGTGASVLAFINFISVLKKAPGSAGMQRALKKLVLFCLSLAAYIVLLKYAGYLFATFIVLFCLLKVSETKGWVIPLIISAGVAAGFYFTFGYLLGVVFP